MFEQLLFLYLYYQTTAFSPPGGIPPAEHVLWPLVAQQDQHGVTRIETAFPQPKRNPDFIKPLLTADATIVKDLGSRTILHHENMHKRLYTASISKLVTAMVILENHDLNETVEITQQARDIEGSKVWFFLGEQLTVEDMLRGLLISSGNDAAVALAIFDSGSQEEFVKKMNEKVRVLGLQNTHFANVMGFDDPINYSTAYDISIFSEAALMHDFIRETVKISKMQIYSIDGSITHKLESTNLLLGHPTFDVIGLKTGRTPGAGEALVSLVRHPDGREILSVILKSDQRFADTEFLLDWIYRAYDF